LYERALKALEADSKNPEGRALARWRLSLIRGEPDPQIEKDLEAAGDKPRAKAIRALAKLVDGERSRGGWEPLAPRILKAAFEKAFPDSASFKTDWVALVRPPEGEIPGICEALAADPDWPLAAAVRSALEGRDVPEPGDEGILWILQALRLTPSEAMKTLESAKGPDRGVLMQAQAQFLAAEGRFVEANGRMTAAPMPLLRAAGHVAAGKPESALDALKPTDTTPFAKALRAAALLQTGTDASLAELASIREAASIPYLSFERGIRGLVAGNKERALEDLQAAAPAGGAVSRAWLGFALWHLQDFGAALTELEKAAAMSPEPELAAAIEEARGFALQAKGDEKGGAERLVDSASKTPTRDAFFKLATHFRGNRQWKALQDLGSAVVRSLASDPEPWAARAEGSFWLKEYDAAIETVTFALQQKIDPKRLLKWRALSYEEQKKWAEAYEDWDKLAQLVTTEGEALCHKAWMAARLGKWSEAKDSAENGFSRGSNAWALALARFALAAEALHGPAPSGEEVDPEGRKEGALEHLRLSVKTGAVEPSDLEKIQDIFKSVAGTEEWKKIEESSAEKQKELKDEAKRGSMLGVMADHGGGSVLVTGTYRKSGARAAGIAPGDVILEVDGKRVNYVGDVGSNLSGKEPGAQVTVKIQREIRPKLKMVQIRTVTLTNRDIFEE
jgi:tetratricopeptide (TPR) repeat protein